MLRAKGEGVTWLTTAMNSLREHDNFNALGVPDLLNQIILDGHDIRVWYIHGHWLDVNSVEDLERAGSFTAEEKD